MKFERTGIILFTENFDVCVSFYADKVGLPVISRLDNEHSKLTVMRFGPGTYLMVEGDGHAVPGGKTVQQSPVKLRFNVRDLDEAAAELKAKGIEVTVRHEPWGSIGDFLDPDGNLCSLRQEEPGDPQFEGLD